MKSQNYQRKQWVVIEAAHALLRESWRDAVALPKEAWRVWLLIGGCGWLLVLLLTLAMAWGMQALMDTGLWSHDLEKQWLAWFIAHSPIVFSDAIWLSSPGDPLIIIAILIATTVIAARMGYPLHAATILLSYLLVSVIVLIGWQSWDRPRPDLVFNGAAAPGFHSFPSGHMAETTIFYGLLCYLWLRQSPYRSERIFGCLFLAVWLGLVGIARLELGTHWLTDIIAGTITGLSWLWVLAVALQRAEAVIASPPPGEIGD
ncbi:MAG: phosphatase PAP2 family protein [Caldilineaceae bacterium]